MHLYFFHNSPSQISANNFVGKDLSEETLKDFLKSIRMLDHPYYRSHNLEEIGENCYHLNVEIDNGDGKKPFVMAIIYKELVTAQEMDIYNSIKNTIKNDDFKETPKEILILDMSIIIECRIQQLMIDKPDNLDKTYGRYIFYLNFINSDSKLKSEKIDW